MRRFAAVLLLAGSALAGTVPQDDSAAAATNDLQVRVERDLAYGPDPLQRLDVYLPGTVRGPILLMVHGGGWAFGDKRAAAMILPKVRYWTARGFVVVSTNYRMLPEAAPLEQAGDVARALALVQRDAHGWGADPARVVLMGHSAGAHLVALLSADPALARAQGAQPWRGTVSLDSAAMDVPALMRARHLPLYDRAFGSDPAGWRSASPVQRFTSEAPPILAVCSSLRRDSCPRAEELRATAARLGRPVQVQGVAKTHAQVDHDLGLPGPYSDSVDRWISSIL
ncbi:MAG: alpha/beta hydrolase [Burkholderiales bacterium]|nr:alpha/beta hydrolase [Burkholderiales bacterium]